MNKVLILLTFFTSLSANAYRTPYKRNLNLEKQVVINYSKLAELSYADALVGAKSLQQKIENFVLQSKNSQNFMLIEKSFEEAKTAWALDARIPYGQTEIFRFINGPIDFEFVDDGFTTYLESINFEGPEGLLNAWPLDEAYIDYVEGDPTAGIINNPTIKITPETISAMNEVNGEKNISTGYHAIEFLLWGQDRSLTGPGSRSAKDYISNSGAINVERRRLYLKTLAQTLTAQLTKVTEQWEAKKINFRKEFESKDSLKSIKAMFISMITMAGDELKSERIENALLLEDQEEEHSCFSDMTVNDIATNAMGVKNIYYGSYKAYNLKKSIKGLGINKLLEEVNPELALKIDSAFNEVFNSIKIFYKNNQLLGKISLSFDVAILREKEKVKRIVNSLNHLDEMLRDAAIDLGIVLDI